MALQSQYLLALVDETDVGILNFEANADESNEFNCKATPPVAIEFAPNFQTCEVRFYVKKAPHFEYKRLTNFDGSDFSIAAQASIRIPLQASQFVNVTYVKAVVSATQGTETSAQFVLAPLLQGIHG